MMTLDQFLARFNTATLQRSISYVGKIDFKSLEMYQDRQNIVVEARIIGSYRYDTTLIFSPLKQAIIDTDCSCPVGYDCKHAAALARYFYDRQNLEQSSLNQPQQNSQQQNHHTAKVWLDQFKQQLAQVKTESQHQLIYVFQPKNNSQQLHISIYKVRRTKDGQIRDTTPYISYDNVLNERLKVSSEEKKIFSHLYFFAKLNFPNAHYYPPTWDISGIYQEQLKTAIQSGTCYALNTTHPILTWSDHNYQLEFNWQAHPQNKTEKLTAQFFDAQHAPLSIEHCQQIYIIHSHPLSYLDTLNNQVGMLESSYSSEMINEFMDMPQMPVEILAEFKQTIQPYSAFAYLPQAQSILNIPTQTGKPTPILKFGYFSQYDRLGQMHHYAMAEIEFEYPVGRIKKGSPDHYFIAQVNEQTVRQQRDLALEKDAIDTLKEAIPSLKWLTQITKSKRPAFDDVTENSIVCANPNIWINQLIPENKIALLGWQVDHHKNSLFNLNATQNLQLLLTESDQKQDWFNVGATIQDSQGQTYNLIELLGYVIQSNPHLLEDQYIDQLKEDEFFLVPITENETQLALSIKDIKPILSYLKDILRYPKSNAIDQYEATQLLNLEHHLGMPWHSNERLKTFAHKLQTSYQQQIATPQGFQGELRHYQQQGLAWLQFLRETEHGGILADDMGLGKTAQTLAHLLIEKQAGRLEQYPALIIAPTSLMHNWRKEAEKFTPELKVLVLQGHDRQNFFDQIYDADIILSTYPLLARDEEFFLSHQYHMLILDEAQNIKNPRAKASQVVRQLNAKHRLCLTGTPMENHLGELWSLFHFLMPGFLYSQDVFNKTYRKPIEKNADLSIKSKLISRIKPFMLRRLKTEVAKELPEKTTIEVNIDMNEQQSKLYEAARATMQKNIRELIATKGFHRSQIQILSALLKLRQVCCHPALLQLDNVKNQNIESAKLDHLLQMVQDMVEEGRKILIFSQFTTMLQIIENQLKILNIPTVKLIGQTKKRDQVITKFQTGDIPVFLISLKAGGVGLNLTTADTVIHYDPWWNPAAEDQASDRAWRIGQKKPVFVYKLITNQSIEEKILALQKNKANLTQSILSIDHENEVKLSENDVMSLLD